MNEFIAPQFPSFGTSNTPCPVDGSWPWPNVADTIVINRLGDSFTVEWRLGGKTISTSQAKGLLSGDTLQINTILNPLPIRMKSI